VLLGAAGGFGLLVGPLGLAALRQTRDRRLARKTRAPDSPFLALPSTVRTGLALLVLRLVRRWESCSSCTLPVLVLLLTLPYGKFVHGLYRLLALIRYHRKEKVSVTFHVRPRMCCTISTMASMTTCGASRGTQCPRGCDDVTPLSELRQRQVRSKATLCAAVDEIRITGRPRDRVASLSTSVALWQTCSI
jgi:hypothetical protein